MSEDFVKLTAERGLQNLKDLLRMLEIEASVERHVADDEVLLHVESPDSGRLIGHDAQMLNALQLLLNRMTPRAYGLAAHITVDVERYRERRKDRLLAEAFAAADRVEESGRPVRLAPMGAGDRRAIHRALESREGVTTHSESADREGLKRIVIEPSAGHSADEIDDGAAPDEPGAAG